MTPDEYLSQRLEDQMDWYDRKSGWNQRWYKRIRVFEILLAASIPFLTGYVTDDTPQIKFVLGSIGVLLAFLGGFVALYRFEENWVGYRATAEALKHHRFKFLTAAPPYDGPDSFRVLVQNVEDLLAQEHKRWTEYVRAKSEEAAEAEVASPEGGAPAEEHGAPEPGHGAPEESATHQ